MEEVKKKFKEIQALLEAILQKARFKLDSKSQETLVEFQDFVSITIGELEMLRELNYQFREYLVGKVNGEFKFDIKLLLMSIPPTHLSANPNVFFIFFSPQSL